MVNALQTALSGMTAFSRSVGTTANNLANVATPEFKRGRTEFQEAQNGGVHTSNSVDSRPGPLIFQQTSQNPVFEEQSNVDMGEEMVNLIKLNGSSNSTSRSSAQPTPCSAHSSAFASNGP